MIDFNNDFAEFKPDQKKFEEANPLTNLEIKIQGSQDIVNNFIDEKNDFNNFGDQKADDEKDSEQSGKAESKSDSATKDEKDENKGEADSYAKGAGGDFKEPKKLKAITDDSFQQNTDKLLDEKNKGYRYGKIPTPNFKRYV